MSDTVKLVVHWQAHLNNKDDLQNIEVPKDVAKDPEKLKNYCYDVVFDTIRDDWGMTIDIVSAKDEWTDEDALDGGWKEPEDDNG